MLKKKCGCVSIRPNVTALKNNLASPPYPTGGIIILVTKFFECFAFYGLKAVLILYLTQKLGYTDDTATIIFHTYVCITFASCLFGAVISDSWLNNFRTISYLASMCAMGMVFLSITAMPVFQFTNREVKIAALLVIGVGAGSIIPCVQAFGGEQFRLPEQQNHLDKFFSLYYMTLNCGILTSMVLTPVFRHDVKCFEESDCFPLAFGVPAMALMIGIAIFIGARSVYIIRPPAGNMFILVSKCIGTAISTKLTDKANTPKSHWLDYAEPKYGMPLITDIKRLLNILVQFIPIPLYWALVELSGSRWTIQATQMNCDLGFYQIKPDQMQFLLPVLIVLFIPLTEFVVYPSLRRISIKSPLQKIAFSGILAAASVISSGLIQLTLDEVRETNSDPVHIAWQLPQYILIAISESIFGIVGMSFAYAEGPKNMKAVMQACWLLPISFGNLIDVIVVKAKIVDSQANEFFVFGAMMIVNVLIFMYLAYRYKSIPAFERDESVKSAEWNTPL